MNQKPRWIDKILPGVVFAALLVAWEVASRAGWLSLSLFPPPSKVWQSLLKLSGNGTLWTAMGITLLRFAVGLSGGALIGALLGLMMGWWPRVNSFLGPFVAAIYPIPKIAIFPILMILFGIGEGSKFVAILLAAFFPMLVTSLAGVQQISRVYVEVAQNYGARNRQMLTHILLPGSLPSLLAGLRLSANMAFVIAISVEIVASRSGLGVLLWLGWQTLRVSEIYAVLLVIALMGIGLNFLFNRLTSIFVPWLGE